MVSQEWVEKAALAFHKAKGCSWEARGLACPGAGASDRDGARAVLAAVLPEAQALAWDEGRAAERRDWEFTFDITTPDEERQPLPNPYREVQP